MHLKCGACLVWQTQRTLCHAVIDRLPIHPARRRLLPLRSGARCRQGLVGAGLFSFGARRICQSRNGLSWPRFSTDARGVATARPARTEGTARRRPPLRSVTRRGLGAGRCRAFFFGLSSKFFKVETVCPGRVTKVKTCHRPESIGGGGPRSVAVPPAVLAAAVSAAVSVRLRHAPAGRTDPRPTRLRPESIGGGGPRSVAVPRAVLAAAVSAAVSVRLRHAPAGRTDPRPTRRRRRQRWASKFVKVETVCPGRVVKVKKSEKLPLSWPRFWRFSRGRHGPGAKRRPDLAVPVDGSPSGPGWGMDASGRGRAVEGRGVIVPGRICPGCVSGDVFFSRGRRRGSVRAVGYCCRALLLGSHTGS